VFRILINAALAASIIATSSVPGRADSYIFRYRSPIADASVTPEEPGTVDPGYGIGNDITVFFAGAVGYEFSKVIPVATKDVVEWRRSKGSYQPGLSLDRDAGVISGIASGSTSPRNAVLLGYDVNGKAIARADITFRFHNPVGTPQNLVFYGHTGKYMFREIPSTKPVTRWVSLTPLPDDFHTDGRNLVGTPSKTYDTSVAFIGYDYMDKEVAFAAGDLIVQDGPTFDRIADKHQHPEDEFVVNSGIQHSVGELKYRLTALDGKPSSLTFGSEGDLRGYIRTFNTALRFQIEAFDADGTRGKSNVFSLSTFAPDIDISDMRDLQGTVGSPYATKLTGEELSGSMDWQVVAGQLPDGLLLDPETGIISGTPTREETQDGIVISVSTSDNGHGETKPFSFKIRPEQVVVSFAAKSVRTGEAFSTDGPSFGTGVINPHSFSLAAGATPSPVLSIDYANAKVSGIAGVAGDYSIPFNFTNGDGRESVFTQPIAAFNPLSLSYDNVIKAFRRIASSAAPSIADQSIIGEPTFTLAAGQLPQGLVLQPKTGLILGEPKATGMNAGIRVRLADESGATTASNTFSIEVEDRPGVQIAINATNVERFVDNIVQVATATNTFDGVTYELVAGQLPAGLSLNRYGQLIGSTSEPEGSYGGLQVKATDGEGYAAVSPVFAISIVAPTDLEELQATDATATWTVGVPFSLPLPQPANAFGKITYDLQDLPEGVTVVGDKLVGTVNAVGTLTFPMKLTDEGHRSLSGPFTLNVLEPMTASLTGASSRVSAFAMMRMATSSTFDLPRGSSTTISAQIANGIEPITYTFQGSLPAGLEYEDGVVSGTPVVENQTGNMLLAITDAAGTAVQLPANIRIANRLPVELSYDFTKPIYLNAGNTLPRKPSVKNGIGAMTYSVEGSLPEGLQFDGRTGYFTGYPKVDGRFPGIVVKATDAEGDDYAGRYGPFEIGVSRLGSISLATTIYYTVRVGESFLKTLNVANVTKPVTFATADGGPMPHGMTLNSVDGSISGSFPEEGTYEASAIVTDDFGRSKSTTIRFTAVGLLSIARPPTISFNQYSSVDARAVATNPIGSVRYEILSGTLPQGLTIDPRSGYISGTPTVKGTAPGIVIKVTDSTGSSAQTAPFTLTVTDRLPLTMNTSASYAVYANMSYKLTLPVTNAVGKVSFTQTGNLPTGIVFDASKGMFTGRATVVGTFSGITVTATDAVGGTVTKTLSLVVSTNGSPINLTVTNFVTKVGYPILTTKPTWSNHVGDVYLWADDTLAQYGLAIDPATGIISGSATKLIDFTPNIHITDGSDRVTSKPVSIKVIPETSVNVPARIDLAVNANMTAVTATATNIVGTGTWKYEGTLPTGITFTAASGRFAGTPTQMGTFGGTLTNTDSLGATGTAQISIVVVNNGLPPTIALTPTPTGYIATAAATITPTYTNKKVGDIVALAPDSASLPPGMSITVNASGVYVLSKVIGTNAEIGVYKGIKLRVTDLDGLYSETAPMTFVYASNPRLAYPAVAFSSRPNVPATLDPPTQSSGIPSAAVSFAFTSKAAGGQNLAVDPATGAISGYITATGTNVVTVTESYDGITIRTFTYNVTYTKLDLSLFMDSFLAIEGAAYTSRTPRLINPISSGAMTLAGDLPAGLSLNPATGVISGTPAGVGTYNVVLTYADEFQTLQQNIAISIVAGDTGHRYWRFQGSKNSQYAGDVFEMNLYSGNFNAMAAGTPSSRPAMIDDNPSTAASAPLNVTFTFDKPVALNKAITSTRTGFETNVTGIFSWSDDGTTWTQAGRFSSGSSTSQTITTTLSN
jgi:hypothetical protein